METAKLVEEKAQPNGFDYLDLLKRENQMQKEQLENKDVELQRLQKCVSNLENSLLGISYVLKRK